MFDKIILKSKIAKENALLAIHKNTPNNLFVNCSRMIQAVSNDKIYKTKAEKLLDAARHSVRYDIKYDLRTGRKPGNICINTYNKKQFKYGSQPTAFFDPDLQNNNYPCLDCSGFVSWLFYCLGFSSWPLNSSRHGHIDKSRKRLKATGNWNIYRSTLIHIVDTPKEGDLLFMPGHIAIISKVLSNEIKEIIHSSVHTKGVGITSHYDKDKYLNEIKRHAKKAAKDLFLECRYVLGRIKE
jgi:hypothetical protein